MREGARGVGDDVGVSGISLPLARIEVRDPPHRQAGQIRDRDSARPSHSDRQRPDRSQLVHHHQHSPMALQVGEQLDQIGFSVPQGTVDEPLTGTVQRHRMVHLTGYVDTAEHLEPSLALRRLGVGLGHLDGPFVVASRPDLNESAGSHVTEGIQTSGHVPISGHKTSDDTGDGTSEIIRTGAESHAGAAGPAPPT